MCYKVRGFFDHIMAYKLKALKNDLKIWNKDVFANVFVRKARALEQIGLRSAKERKGVLSEARKEALDDYNKVGHDERILLEIEI